MKTFKIKYEYIIGIDTEAENEKELLEILDECEIDFLNDAVLDYTKREIVGVEDEKL